MAGEHAVYRVLEAGERELGELTRMRLAWSADHGFAATDDFPERMRQWWDQQAGHRRRGVGRLLMEAVLAWAREQRMVRLVLNPSEVSLPLYSGLGFQPADNLMRLDL